MSKGCRIVVGGKICRFVEIVHSSWDGTKVIFITPKGYLSKISIEEVRVPRLKMKVSNE